MGRFCNADPTGIWADRAQIGNGYAYAKSNPLSYRDVLGLQAGPGEFAGNMLGGLVGGGVGFVTGLGGAIYEGLTGGDFAEGFQDGFVELALIPRHRTNSVIGTVDHPFDRPVENLLRLFIERL